MTSKERNQMTRRDFLTRGAGALAGATLIGGLGKAALGAAKPSRKPNILFIFPDQMRAPAMGCAGDTNVKTPNLDKLASQGIRFTNAISSYPVCSPYRASLLTGRYATSHGVVVNETAILDSEITIAEALKGQGYKTGYIGKWHLERTHDPFVPKNRRQGFDFWAVRGPGGPHFDTFCCMDTPDQVPMPGWEPDNQTNFAIDFIKKNAKEPFCLFLSWGPPHPLYEAPEKYEAMYKDAKLKQRPNVTGTEGPANLPHYYAMITSLDDDLKRLMDTLDELGIAQDTIVCFSSDHGDMMGGHGLIGKNVPWDESIKVPFILRYPKKVKAAQKSDVLLNCVDVMPTLLGLCGAPIPKPVEGANLSSFVLGKGGKKPESALLMRVIAPKDRATGVAEWRGVRTERYTYVRGKDKTWLLYDNHKDPYQMSNLIDKPESKEIQAKLDADLQAWLKKIGDDFAPSAVWLTRIKDRVNPKRLGGKAAVQQTPKLTKEERAKRREGRQQGQKGRRRQNQATAE